MCGRLHTTRGGWRPGLGAGYFLPTFNSNLRPERSEERVGGRKGGGEGGEYAVRCLCMQLGHAPVPIEAEDLRAAAALAFAPQLTRVDDEAAAPRLGVVEPEGRRIQRE